ncbi:exosome complex component RRP46 [Episyrphus balteatus]|uniref:exosome complex component RRP46 n=1 Tax=Episyrphus balteatus TaxID=286459 RepID=UPI0024863411|nr:exosome complex component RRP46 [Episyrphus balteatus]
MKMTLLSTNIESDTKEIENDIAMRPINCELNPLTGADGSALHSQGETSVLASMYGPIEARTQHAKIEKANVEVIYRPKAGLPTIKDKFRECILRNTCETALLTALHPRTTISIQLQEMDNRCGLEACAINAACLALLAGGVPMKFTIAAVHSIVDRDNQLVLDPDHRQAVGAVASFIFVFDSLDKNLVACNTNGRFNLAQYNDALLMCKAASEIVFKFYKNIIAKSHSKLNADQIKEEEN